jgi:hypothetical protein
VPARGALLIADSSRPEALKALPGMIAEIQAQPDAGRSLTRAIYLSEEGKPQRRVA